MRFWRNNFWKSCNWLKRTKLGCLVARKRKRIPIRSTGCFSALPAHCTQCTVEQVKDDIMQWSVDAGDELTFIGGTSWLLISGQLVGRVLLQLKLCFIRCIDEEEDRWGRGNNIMGEAIMLLVTKVDEEADGCKIRVTRMTLKRPLSIVHCPFNIHCPS